MVYNEFRLADLGWRIWRDMNRSDIVDLHYIAPIANIASIIEHGILSNRRAARLPHESIAMQEVQGRRVDKRIPGGRALHDYVNLYVDAHNPMLSKRRSQNHDICVLRVDAQVLDLDGVIVADRNAASSYARFYPMASGIAALDKDLVYARYWTHQDPYEAMTQKSIKCAEVLVPDRVDATFITGAYVADEVGLAALKTAHGALPATINHSMFF